MTWSAVQVHSKKVHLIQRDIQQTNRGTLVPTYAMVRYVDGKRSSRERQTFPGYMFVELDGEGPSLRDIDGVYGVLGAVRPDEMHRVSLDHATGAWNEIDAAPAKERRRHRRRRPRPGRRFRMLARANAAREIA